LRGQPALLLELGGVAERARVGEDAVLKPGQEDDGELETFRRVQRHQRHNSAAPVVVGDLVGVGDQRDLFEELRQRAAAGGGRRPGTGSTFTMRLPATAVTVDQAEPAAIGGTT